MRAHAQDFTGRIDHLQREAQRLVSTSELPAVLTGSAEVLDGKTLRYVETGLTVELTGIDICSADQKATMAGTPWPCGTVATAWLVSQSLGRDVQCQRFGRGFDGIIQARCAIDGADIAGEAILAGHAIVNRATRPGVPVPLATYIELEDRARAAGSGLWSSQFTRPQDHRRQRFEENAAQFREIETQPPSVSPGPSETGPLP